MAGCLEIEPKLSAYVDDALTAEERADVARHLDQCAQCRGLARDLERLRSTARQLGPIRPPDHIWLEIAGQVHATGGTPAPQAAASPRRPVVWQWAGLAAMLVLVTMAVYFVMRTPRVAPAGNAGRDQAVQAVADELQLAMQHYENAIAQLEALTKNSDGTIDPTVAAMLQKNLTVVDEAIAESRMALASNPESEPARESLFEALRRKVGVLQATVSLMNQMRQGNPAGAADAASGLGRKSS